MLKEELSWLFRRAFLKWLAIGAVASFILVWFFSSSLFVKPLYRSEAVIFVPLTLFSQQFDQQGIGFGGDAEIDGHIQILQSTRMLDSLDVRFNLAQQYSIDVSRPGGMKQLYDRIMQKINIQKTRYNSVSVSVLDRDRELAADMANAIVHLGDVIKEDLLLENRLAAYHFARELYVQKLEEVDALEKTLAVADSLIDGNLISSPSPSRRELITYESQIWELAERRNRYETLRKSLDVPLPRSYVISPAVAAAGPAWPPRLLLSLAAMGVFIASMVVVELLRKDVIKK